MAGEQGCSAGSRWREDALLEVPREWLISPAKCPHRASSHDQLPAEHPCPGHQALLSPMPSPPLPALCSARKEQMFLCPPAITAAWGGLHVGRAARQSQPGQVSAELSIHQLRPGGQPSHGAWKAFPPRRRGRNLAQKGPHLKQIITTLIINNSHLPPIN